MATVITVAKDWLGQTTALREGREHGKLIMEFLSPKVEVTTLGIFGRYALNVTERNRI